MPKLTFKHIGAWTGILCVACCTLPLIGLATGSAVLAGLAIYSEKAVVAVLMLAAIALGYLFFLRKKPRSCDLDCGSKPTLDNATPHKKD